MYCKNCNAEIPETSTFCQHCGANLNSIDSNISTNYQGGTYQNNKPIDNPSHLAGAVSCCFPIVGLILYFLWKDEKPNSASLICKWMIAGIIAWVIFYVLFFVIGVVSSSMYNY